MTIEKLMSSKGRFTISPDKCDNFNAVHIEICLTDPNKCAYSFRTLCNKCTRSCGICEQLFCPLCSNSNFDAEVDRYLCLDCEERVKYDKRSSTELAKEVQVDLE